MAMAAPLLAVALGLGLVAWALPTLVPDAGSAIRYARLAEDVPSPAGPRRGGDAQAGPDWESLPSSCVAWLAVGGTSVDLPVAMATDADPEYYLSHDLWGSPTGMGCPFVDHRCGSADASLVVCYGHRTYLAGSMFGDLSPCWRQESFDELGELEWSTPAGGTEVLVPLCAARVASDWHQELVGTGEGGQLGAWTSSLLSEASAASRDARELAGGASRCVTLVTCSETTPGQPWRTLVAFVDLEGRDVDGGT